MSPDNRRLFHHASQQHVPSGQAILYVTNQSTAQKPQQGMKDVHQLKQHSAQNNTSCTCVHAPRPKLSKAKLSCSCTPPSEREAQRPMSCATKATRQAGTLCSRQQARLLQYHAAVVWWASTSGDTPTRSVQGAVATLWTERSNKAPQHPLPHTPQSCPRDQAKRQTPGGAAAAALCQ